MTLYGRIKEGTVCVIDRHAFYWPDMPEPFRRENFSKDMIFNVDDSGKGLKFWTDGYGGAVNGRPGHYGSGSVDTNDTEALIEVDAVEAERIISMSRIKWRLIHKDRDSYVLDYAVMTMDDGNLTMAALRLLFPTGEANAENFVLFSTSGVHGTYDTIEEVEAQVKQGGTFDGLTFLVVQPRIVSLRYGRAYPETEDDFAFLKKLRETSLQAVSQIGQPSKEVVANV